MRLMKWSWEEYLTCPEFHLAVLKDRIQVEAKEAAHKRALAESRQRRR